MNNRINRLRQELTRRELDAILISQPQNRRYLSGFSGSAGFLLISKQEAVLATDFRYTEQATSQAPDYKIFQISGSLAAWLPELIANLGGSNLGFEDGHVTFALHQQLSNTLKETKSGLSLTPVGGLVESLRAIKEPEEIELIAKSAEITDAAFEEVTDRVQPGTTEKQLAWELEKSLREHGSEAMAFEVIVASGPNAALPHARPSEHQIQPGEPVVIDMGARVGGYCSDLSRTICLGTPDDKFRQVYSTVFKAQSAAIAGINEGMSGHDADALARAVMAAHEEPRLGPNSEDTLRNNMVFSIEPGIYLSGWGGVRIEDLAVMDSGRPRLLSNAKKWKPEVSS